MELLARDDRAVAGAEKLRFFPLAVTGGSGSYLVEEGGRQLLDLSASWTAAEFPHCLSGVVVARINASMDAGSMPERSMAIRPAAVAMGMVDPPTCRSWIPERSTIQS